MIAPAARIPPGGSTNFVEDFTLAVSGAAGSAAIIVRDVTARHGRTVPAVLDIGQNTMGGCVLLKPNTVGIELANIDRGTCVSRPGSIEMPPQFGRRVARRINRLGVRFGAGWRNRTAATMSETQNPA